VHRHNHADMKADATIRPYAPEDAPGAADVLRQVFPHPTAISATGVEHWVAATPERARLRVWVASTETGPVAWADSQLKWSTTENGVGELFVAVEPAARGRGIGAALVGACLARARSAGLARIGLYTQPAMLAAQRLYDRLGFRRSPDRDWPVPDSDLTLLAYTLELDGSAP